MIKKIKFHPSSINSELYVPMPKPARNYAPTWYSETKFFHNNRPEYLNGVVDNITVKGCAPFSDAMNFGYIQETWTDIYIEQKNDGLVEYHYKNGEIPIMKHRNRPTGVKIPEEFYDIEFVWIQPWAPIVPKGYSVLYTNPLNNNSLNTFSTSAVVDADVFSHVVNGQYPFFIKKGFNGIIPSGTPMYQIIPFKRDSWQAEHVNFNERHSNLTKFELHSKFWGVYKKYYRKEKKFK